MVAMVCGGVLGVRVAIPQMEHVHSADPGGEAESFNAEWGGLLRPLHNLMQLLVLVLSMKGEFSSSNSSL